MACPDYNKLNWIDDAAPGMSAASFNHMDEGIYQLAQCAKEAEIDVSERIERSGDAMTGQLKGIDPVDEEDLTRKDYVDEGLALKLSLTGGTLTDNLIVHGTSDTGQIVVGGGATTNGVSFEEIGGSDIMGGVGWNGDLGSAVFGTDTAYISIDDAPGLDAFQYHASGGTYSVWHGGHQGAGTGMDADKLDGHDASYFSPATHTHTCTDIGAPCGSWSFDSSTETLTITVT